VNYDQTMRVCLEHNVGLYAGRAQWSCITVVVKTNQSITSAVAVAVTVMNSKATQRQRPVVARY